MAETRRAAELVSEDWFPKTTSRWPLKAPIVAYRPSSQQHASGQSNIAVAAEQGATAGVRRCPRDGHAPRADGLKTAAVGGLKLGCAARLTRGPLTAILVSVGCPNVRRLLLADRSLPLESGAADTRIAVSASNFPVGFLEGLPCRTTRYLQSWTRFNHATRI